MVMPYGLANSPASFQRLMQHVLAGLQWKFCLVYIDDIVIYTNEFDLHLEHIEQVFKRLTLAGLKLKPSKCRFAMTEISYLGHIVSQAGIRPDPSKVDAIRLYPAPTDLTELRRFLGMVGFFAASSLTSLFVLGLYTTSSVPQLNGPGQTSV